MIKYSILVPVYNTEKYLANCIDSVLVQSFKNFELILTDDGSNDNSAAICADYAKRDERVKFYQKDNEGLLLTRRFALKKAQGEYVLFLDSDDYWEEDLLETIDSVIIQKAVDIVLYRFNSIDDNGHFISPMTSVFGDMTLFDQDNKDIVLGTFLRSNQLNTMWTKCVKKDIIDIEEDYSRFKDKKGEDKLQSISLMLNANSFFYLDRPLVNYRLSINGRGRNYKTKYALDTLSMHQHIFDKVTAAKLSDVIIIYAYEGFFRDICESILPALPKSCSLKTFIKIMEDISGTELFRYAICSKNKLVLSRKERFLIGLINNKLYTFLFYLYRIYRLLQYKLKLK